MTAPRVGYWNRQ